MTGKRVREHFDDDDSSPVKRRRKNRREAGEVRLTRKKKEADFSAEKNDLAGKRPRRIPVKKTKKEVEKGGRKAGKSKRVQPVKLSKGGGASSARVDLTEIDDGDTDSSSRNFSYGTLHGREGRVDSYEVNEILAGGTRFISNDATDFILTKLFMLSRHTSPKKFTYYYDRSFLSQILSGNLEGGLKIDSCGYGHPTKT